MPKRNTQDRPTQPGNCSRCNGSGKDPQRKGETCGQCGGDGKAGN